MQKDLARLTPVSHMQNKDLVGIIVVAALLRITMKKALLTSIVCATSLILTGGAAFSSTPGYVLAPDAEQRSAALNARVQWTDSLEQASRDAFDQHKIILWVQLVGRLDGAT